MYRGKHSGPLLPTMISASAVASSTPFTRLVVTAVYSKGLQANLGFHEGRNTTIQHGNAHVRGRRNRRVMGDADDRTSVVMSE